MNVPVLLLIGSFAYIGLLAMFFGRSGRWLGSVLLVITLGTAGFILWRSARYARAFDAIDLGASPEEVKAKMGAPGEVTDCSTSFGGSPRSRRDPAAPGCATEYWYYAVWAPGAWSFTFDSQGVLIDKYQWASP